MKYVISYECRTEAEKFISEFQIENEQAPSVTDENIIEHALRDSVKFFKSGQAGITITAIKLAT
jgi:hypothetical protein